MKESNNNITSACPKCHADVSNIKILISENGLLRKEENIEIYVMCKSCKAFVVEDTLEKAIDQWNKGHVTLHKGLEKINKDKIGYLISPISDINSIRDRVIDSNRL